MLSLQSAAEWERLTLYAVSYFLPHDDHCCFEVRQHAPDDHVI